MSPMEILLSLFSLKFAFHNIIIGVIYRPPSENTV